MKINHVQHITVKKDNPLYRLINRMREDKNSIRQYFNGEISIEELNNRGVKFVKAI